MSPKGGKAPSVSPGGKAKSPSKSGSGKDKGPSSPKSKGPKSPGGGGSKGKGGGGKGGGGKGGGGPKGTPDMKKKQGATPKGKGGANDRKGAPKGAGAKAKGGQPKMAKQGGGGARKNRGFIGRLIGKMTRSVGGGEKIVLSTPEAREAAAALGLSNQNLSLLKEKYDGIDLDGSGEIDQDEFFDALNENRSPFTDGLFALIDQDGSGTVEFDEYVVVLSTYCMYTKEDILKFCFDLFDVDGSNTIDEKEFVELVKCVNNASPMFPGNFGTAIQMFDVNDDGLIDFNEFIEIDRRFPLVLYPAFKLQDKMQRLTLGEKEWNSINKAVVRCSRDQEYRETHNGRPMPEGMVRGFLKKYMKCCIDTRVVDVEKITAARPAAIMRQAEAAKGSSNE